MLYSRVFAPFTLARLRLWRRTSEILPLLLFRAHTVIKLYKRDQQGIQQASLIAWFAVWKLEICCRCLHVLLLSWTVVVVLHFVQSCFPIKVPRQLTCKLQIATDLCCSLVTNTEMAKQWHACTTWWLEPDKLASWKMNVLPTVSGNCRYSKIIPSKNFSVDLAIKQQRMIGALRLEVQVKIDAINGMLQW